MRVLILAVLYLAALLALGMTRKPEEVTVFYPGPCDGKLQLQAESSSGDWMIVKEVEPYSCIEINENFARSLRSCCGDLCAEPGLDPEPISRRVCK